MPVSELPVTLPDMEDFKPTRHARAAAGQGAGRRGCTRQRRTARGSSARRTRMPQWAGSCWYYLRFCDTKNSEQFIDPAVEKYWLPVDLYIGGAEHAVLHLLYSRFWHKVLFDRGHVSTCRAVSDAGESGDDPGRDGVDGLSSRTRVDRGSGSSTDGQCDRDDGSREDESTTRSIQVEPLLAVKLRTIRSRRRGTSSS